MSSLFKLTLLGILILDLVACGSGSGVDSDHSPAGASQRVTSKIFPSGCVSNGQAKAGQVDSPYFEVEGPNALGSTGDYLLANDHAAFVISGIDSQKTYYHYGGILIDAFTLDNCRQESADNFYELALMVVRASLTPTSSRLRAFRGESVEIINDGSDGKAAIVRVHGTDDRYWLAETVLMQESQLNGVYLDYSQPFGLDIAVDYILQPGAKTLEIQYRLTNKLNKLNSFNAAFGLLTAGEGPELHSFSPFDVEIDRIVDIPTDLALEYGIPWVSSGDGLSTFIYGVDSKHLSAANVIGVEGLLDASQLANTWGGVVLNAQGYPNDSYTETFFVTVGNEGEVNAVREHVAASHSPVDTFDTPVDIMVRDKLTGEPVAHAMLQFQAKKQILLVDWPWETFLTAQTDATGRYVGTVPFVSYLKNQPYQVIATQPGRETSEPVVLTPSLPNQVKLTLGGKGSVRYQVSDEQGRELPSQISFWQDTTLVERFYLNSGKGELSVVPGTYQVAVSHGWEYGIIERELEVLPNQPVVLHASLKHWVDTRGYMSFDAHVHSSPSADSTVSLPDRITTAAATGLEVVVSTDHEFVTDLAPAVIETGLQDWVATVIGQEVTAALPNHTIAYPLPAKHSGNPRGDPVEWYQMDIGQIYAAEKARGAQIRTLAHPRLFILDALQWDHVAGAPGITDPKGLGIPEGGVLWSWDFEAMEYMNGIDKVFSGKMFEDWMSFINHGHRITATGSSDMHDYKPPGMPRNYFVSPTDNPVEFDEDDLVAAVKQGRVVVSTGAFARVKVNNQAGMGDTVTDTDGQISLALQVEALPDIDMSHAKVFLNCDEVMTVNLNNPKNSALKYQDTLALTLPDRKDAHLVVLGFGARSLPREFPQFSPRETPFFTTNPIYIDADGNGRFDAPGGKTCQYTY